MAEDTGYEEYYKFGNINANNTYSANNRLQDGYNRGVQLAQSGGTLPPVGTKGFEPSNLTNSVIAGFNSWEIPAAPKIETSSAPQQQQSAPATKQKAPKAPAAPANVNLPSLVLGEGTSVENQLNRLQSLDSLTMQQAKQNALERGTATGEIHSSQQGGAAQRAVSEALMPLATAEAGRKAKEEISNWDAAVKAEMDRFDKEYAGYLAKLGFASNERMNMVQAQTSLATAMMGNMTSLMNNTDLVMGDAVTGRLVEIFNSAMKNNNTILDFGFSY